ncbi:MAG: endonuclease MutS2 [Deltaproteobacteria bacterium]|nr:endonuclease MutS2 [Candidatus Zymogenaceae bacterium]
MDKRTLEVLEYPKILKILADFASTIPGSEDCLDLFPETNSAGVSRIQTIVKEIREISAVEGKLPFGGICAIDHLLSQLAVQGAHLSSHEILDIAGNLSGQRILKSLLATLSERYPNAAGLVSSIVSMKGLESQIESAVGPQGEILDGASDHLREIRKRVRSARDELNRTLLTVMGSSSTKEALQEPIVTQRNGRYVLPIKAEYKGKIQGIVHDRSQSSQTLFIEPISVMEKNNELSSFTKEEKDEELRVLKRISAEIALERDTIAQNHRAVIEIDTLAARALFGEALNGVSAEIDDSGKVSFIEARHPLLLHSGYKNGSHEFSSHAIPIDIAIGGDKKLVVLSGANTGGKTAALKTLGLLSLMFMTGIPIPVAEGSRAVVFSDLFADIGDEQDIEGKLSTFSAKVERLKYILSQAGPGSLVLIDEIMSATDPDQGSALAMASMDYLLSKNATILITTHLNTLKTYALNRADSVNVSVTFDEMSRTPLYILHYGTPGGSNAIAVAQSLSLPPEVISRAKENLSDESRKLTSLITKLERDRRIVQTQRRAVETLRKDHQSLTKELAGLVETINAKRNEIIDSFRREVKEIASRYEQRFKELFGRMENAAVRRGEIHKEFYDTKRALIDSIPQPALDTQSPDEFHVGDAVALRGSAVIGSLLTLSGDRAEVEFGGRKVSVDISELKKEKAPSPPRGGAYHEQYSDPKTEINIIGLTVEDAIPVVDKAIDNAILVGLAELEIIHGKGTGRLKRGIRTYLTGHSHVKGLKHGGLNDGTTTVELS